MYDYVIADVFTDTALEGNPLAVLPDAAGLSAECMQRIAREMNLSETTFVFPPIEGGDVRVRIFTPVGELPFAGHPTFGTAVVLAAIGHPSVRDGGLRMETGMGVVPFRFTGREPRDDGGLRERAQRGDGTCAAGCDGGLRERAQRGDGTCAAGCDDGSMGVVPFRFTGREPHDAGGLRECAQRGDGMCAAGRDGGLRERAQRGDGTRAAGCDDGGLGVASGMGVVPFRLTGREHRARRAITARMRQPIPVWEPYARAGELLAALGVRESTLPVEVYRNGPRHAFVGLDSVEALSALRVDLRALAAHEDLAANCFAPTDDPLVWRARMFSPAYGVTEDAGTGSAAGPLALHLGRHGLVPLGGAITVRQGVEMGRPSTIRAQVSMLGGRVDRVEIAGSAVVVADGRLHI
nr:hypothetical protein GCM10020063_051380 [Dactylosporangium thailandense]